MRSEEICSQPIKSLKSGELPLEWKQANISPIFQKASRALSLQTTDQLA